ncbi:hypothetical protein LMG28138_05520 [Pararobbsia alpina]|uniref:Uncharacterized protein n=1 Tax=Pararobbsia alpina TaxID=621374 RepID=A0A6S7BLW3_9BURK|nr:hypothetical protein LMG28138_05520 [Pararobbsia alpina]
MRSVQIEPFAHPALETWLRVRNAIATDSPYSFQTKAASPYTVVMVGDIVRDALLAIDVQTEEMSPRLLRTAAGDCRQAAHRTK